MATTFLTRSAQCASSPDFLDYVHPDLRAIESRLESEITSDVRKVYALTGHVLSAGGKRLRPAMVALSARAVCDSPSLDRIVILGAGVEMVHMATLVHDDVIDNTETRRGKPTANAIFGNGVAVLTGDFLLARAMRLLANDGDMRVIRAISDVTIEMSEGEVLEVLATGNAALSRDEYNEILRKKTAIFVEGCCRAGAIIGGGTQEQEDTLGEYGYRLGMAFQIADDLLDYSGDPLVTGKAIGSDLKDGRCTLPFMIAMERGSAIERTRLLRAFGNAELADDELLEIVRLMDRLDVFEETRCAALAHVRKAESALRTLPDSRAQECFNALTDYVVKRDH